VLKVRAMYDDPVLFRATAVEGTSTIQGNLFFYADSVGFIAGDSGKTIIKVKLGEKITYSTSDERVHAFFIFKQKKVSLYLYETEKLLIKFLLDKKDAAIVIEELNNRLRENIVNSQHEEDNRASVEERCENEGITFTQIKANDQEKKEQDCKIEDSKQENEEMPFLDVEESNEDEVNVSEKLEIHGQEDVGLIRVEKYSEEETVISIQVEEGECEKEVQESETEEHKQENVNVPLIVTEKDSKNEASISEETNISGEEDVDLVGAEESIEGEIKISEEHEISDQIDTGLICVGECSEEENDISTQVEEQECDKEEQDKETEDPKQENENLALIVTEEGSKNATSISAETNINGEEDIDFIDVEESIKGEIKISEEHEISDQKDTGLICVEECSEEENDISTQVEEHECKKEEQDNEAGEHKQENENVALIVSEGSSINEVSISEEIEISGEEDVDLIGAGESIEGEVQVSEELEVNDQKEAGLISVGECSEEENDISTQVEEHECKKEEQDNETEEYKQENENVALIVSEESSANEVCTSEEIEISSEEDVDLVGAGESIEGEVRVSEEFEVNDQKEAGLISAGECSEEDDISTQVEEHECEKEEQDNEVNISEEIEISSEEDADFDDNGERIEGEVSISEEIEISSQEDDLADVKEYCEEDSVISKQTEECERAYKESQYLDEIEYESENDDSISLRERDKEKEYKPDSDRIAEGKKRGNIEAAQNKKRVVKQRVHNCSDINKIYQYEKQLEEDIYKELEWDYSDFRHILANILIGFFGEYISRAFVDESEKEYELARIAFMEQLQGYEIDGILLERLFSIIYVARKDQITSLSDDLFEIFKNAYFIDIDYNYRDVERLDIYSIKTHIHTHYENEIDDQDNINTLIRQVAIERKEAIWAEKRQKRFAQLVEKISAFILSQKKPVSKTQIRYKFGYCSRKVFAEIGKNRGIIDYKNEFYALSCIDFNDEDKTELLTAIFEELDSNPEGICAIDQIIEQYYYRFESLFLRAYANSADRVRGLIEKLFFDEINVEKPYISKRGVMIPSPQDRIMRFLSQKEETKVSELLDYMKENCLKTGSLLKIFDAVKGRFLLKNRETLIDIDCIEIDETIAQIVADKIRKELSDKNSRNKENNHASVVNCAAVRDLKCLPDFPIINIPWDEWLIYSMFMKWPCGLHFKLTAPQFDYSIPIVSLSAYVSKEAIEDIAAKHAGNIRHIATAKIDDLDNLDDLIADEIDLDDIDLLDDEDFDLDDEDFELDDEDLEFDVDALESASEDFDLDDEDFDINISSEDDEWEEV